MSRLKPWDTSGPPRPRSKREKGRDQRFKEKMTGVPERDKPPKPGGLTGNDWTDVDWSTVTPISDAFYEIQADTHKAAKQFGKAQRTLSESIEKLRKTVREREELTAARGVIEDEALAREEPGIPGSKSLYMKLTYKNINHLATKKGRENTQKR